MDAQGWLKRDSPFSYTCNQCSRCCYNKTIKLNPYEVARLAYNQGMSTSDFLRQHTEARGTVLKRVEAGACVFLTPTGCGVHPDRPLVCRLYPLGRHVTANGEESFSELAPHPESSGVYGTNHTVADYLESQGTGPFIGAVDRYLSLLRRMVQCMSQNLRADAMVHDTVVKALVTPSSASDNTIPDWLDMDSVVDEHCEKHGLNKPSDPAQKMDLHIRVVETWLETMVNE